MFIFSFVLNFFAIAITLKYLLYMKTYNAYCMAYQIQNGRIFGEYITHRILLAKKSDNVLTLLTVIVNLSGAM